MTIMQPGFQGNEQLRPIQLIQVGSRQAVPAPLIRVMTCGLLGIEVVEEIVSLDPPLARYVSLPVEQLRGRGTLPALTLLKLLVSRHARFAPRDWLREQYRRDGEAFASERLSNIVSQLRSLLCPPAYEDLRRQIVAHVHCSISSGDGYQLALYPLVWCDHEALTWHVEQAARMERFCDNGLPFWQRAYDLAKRGEYLPAELYSLWTSFRRGEVAGMLRQSVQALARLYQARYGVAGEEEALLLLRRYWLEHPREEDILRPLMELLGRRECFQQAHKYYERLCTLLAEDQGQPDPRTQDVAVYLQLKQIQRPSRVLCHQHEHLPVPASLVQRSFLLPPFAVMQPVSVDVSRDPTLPSGKDMSDSPDPEAMPSTAQMLSTSVSLSEEQTHQQ